MSATPIIPPASTFEEVVARLDDIIADARTQGSRLGYFAALYRHVAVKFKECVEQRVYEHPEIIERLDVIFFNRYLEALDRYRRGQATTRSWSVAFQAARSSWPITLQHLTLGMNAHINFDLGVAVAETCEAEGLPLLQNDFNKMNAILASLLGDVQDDLTDIWPTLGVLDRLTGKREDLIINFDMEIARAHAWQFAQSLASLSETDRLARIVEVDRWVADLGRGIWRLPFPLNLVALLIRLTERQTVPQTIDILLHHTGDHGVGERV